MAAGSLRKASADRVLGSPKKSSNISCTPNRSSPDEAEVLAWGDIEPPASRLEAAEARREQQGEENARVSNDKNNKNNNNNSNSNSCSLISATAKRDRNDCTSASQSRVTASSSPASIGTPVTKAVLEFSISLSPGYGYRDTLSCRKITEPIREVDNRSDMPVRRGIGSVRPPFAEGSLATTLNPIVRKRGEGGGGGGEREGQGWFWGAPRDW